MKRSTQLLLASAVALAGCVDTPTAPDASQVPAGPFRNVAESGASGSSERHIVVFTSSSKIPETFESRVASLGGSIEAAYGQIGVAVVTGLSAEAADQLELADDVAAVDPDLVVQMIDPIVDGVEGGEEAGVTGHNPAAAFFYPRQWHLRAIGAQTAWAAGAKGSPSVTVAILDTGLDYTHADLVGRVDLNRSRSFVPSDDAFLAANFPGAHPVADMHYHGTHVGATVSSNASAAAGVTAHVTLMGVKVLSRTGSGSTSGTLAGIMYAADAGADVINMSLGIQSPLFKPNFQGLPAMFNRVINYAHRQGAVVVVSAGNENINMDTFGEDWYKVYCTIPNVVCVSATGPTSGGTVGPWLNVDNRAPYSNYGVEWVTVAAPGGAAGGSVWAACSRFSFAIPVCRTGTYVVGISGTSMAAPHASGVAALIVERVGKDKPGQVRNRLSQTSDDLGPEGSDPIYGKGRINAARAVGL